MNSTPARWSEEKQKDLQALLSGMWAEDEWVIQPHRKDGKPHKHHYHFVCSSPFLNIELKYAFWQKFERGEWKLESNTSQRIYFLHHFVNWLNEIAPHGLS